MKEGWIALHRDIQKHWIYEDAEYFRAWMTLLLKASYAETRHKVKTKIYKVKRGEFFATERELAESWCWSQTKVKAFLNLLKDDKMITIDVSTGKSRLCIVNYCDYQDQESTEKAEKKQEKSKEKSQKKQEKSTKVTSKQINKVNNTSNLSNDKLCQPTSDSDILKTPHQDIVSKFNELCPSLPKVKTINEPRKVKIRTRWKENPNMDYWSEIFRKMEESDFLTGRDGAWHNCSFDWVIANNKNHIKIQEGNYINKKSENKTNKVEYKPKRQYDVLPESISDKKTAIEYIVITNLDSGDKRPVTSNQFNSIQALKEKFNLTAEEIKQEFVKRGGKLE